MAITGETVHLSLLQSHSALHALASEDIGLGDSLMEDVVDDAGSQSIPVTPDKPPEKPRQTRNTALCESDWDRQRELIAFLYPTMTLSKLMKEMECRGFYAERGVYNRYITKWRINKNFKASEKQTAIDLRNNLLLKSDSITNPSIPLHRLKRHEKDCRRRARKNSQRSSSVSTKPAHTQPLSFQSPTKSRQATTLAENFNDWHTSSDPFDSEFLYTPPGCVSERFLARLRDHIQSGLFSSSSFESGSRDGSVGRYERPVPQQRMHEYFDMACHAVKARENTKALYWLDRANGYACEVLQKATWRLVNVFGALQKLSNLDFNFGKSVVRFFARMAKVVYKEEPSHCVVHLLHLFLQLDCRNNMLELAGQVAMDSVKESIPEDTVAIALAQTDVISMYDNSELYYSAVQLAEKCRAFCFDNFTKTNYISRLATKNLAAVYCRIGDHEQAYRTEKELLQLYERDSLLPDDLSAGMLMQLGTNSLALGRPEEAMYHYSELIFQLQHLSIARLYPESRDSMLKFSQRMAHNISQIQPGVLSMDWVEGDDATLDKTDYRRADNIFAECCIHHGWSDVDLVQTLIYL